MPKSINVSNIRHGNPGVSGWYAILPEPKPPVVLENDITADWLVIGGGFAGLAAAQRLQQLRQNERIVLLDSLRIGEGSSGRNSGFMIDLPHDISTDNYVGAVERDVLQTQKNRYALSFAAEAAEEYGFSKEVFNPCGKINAAASESGDIHNREYMEHLKAMGEDSTWLDAELYSQRHIFEGLLKDFQEILTFMKIPLWFHLNGLTVPGRPLHRKAR